MPLKELYVRVNLKTKSQKRFRCGTQFSREWTKLVNVAEANAKRFHEDQMLEVSADVPADYVEPAPAAPAAPVAPTDPAERDAAIKAAIAKLDKADTALWTATGLPKLPAVSAMAGFDVTQAERDAVWAEVSKAV